MDVVGRYAVVRTEFNATSSEDLSLQVGEIVLIEAVVDRNWLRGRKAGDYCGLFPKGCTELLKLKIEKDLLEHVEKLFYGKNSFSSAERGDLNFSQGCIVRGVRRVDSNWWYGEVDGRDGIFPLNFVTEIPLPSVHAVGQPKSSTTPIANKKGTRAQVTADLKAELPDEIDLHKGEEVFIEEYIDKFYCRGTSADGQRSGIFPIGFVRIAEVNDTQQKSIVATEVPRNTKNQSLGISTNNQKPQQHQQRQSNLSRLSADRNGDPSPYALARFPFRAEYTAELSFVVGDLISLIRHIDDEWTEGELNGRIGIFPTTYVDIIVDCEPEQNDLHDHQTVQEESRSSRLDSTVLTDIVSSIGDQRMVLYNFHSCEPGDVDASAGDMVVVAQTVNAEWLRVVNLTNGSKGLIPANFVDGIKIEQKARSADSHNIIESDNGVTASHAVVFRGVDPWPQFKQHENTQFSRSQFQTTKHMSIDESISRNMGSLATGTITSKAASSLGNPPAQAFAVKPQRPTIIPPTSGKSVGVSNGTGVQKPPEARVVAQTFSTSSFNSTDYGSQESVKSKPPRPQSLPAKHLPVIDLESERQRRSEQQREERRAMRIKVFNELLQGERDYVNEMKVLREVVELENMKNRIPGCECLVTVLPPLIQVSDKLSTALSRQADLQYEMQEIGNCFLTLREQLVSSFGMYSEHLDELKTFLDRCEETAEGKRFLENCCRGMQRKVTCFSIATAAMRPVQRVLKYPLFLDELLKATEDDHVDKLPISRALEYMTAIAQSIDQAKHRKDIVLKYRKSQDEKLADRLSKLNMHSMRKKSSRFSMRLTSSIGFGHVDKDEQFDILEQEFRALEKVLKLSLKDIQSYCDQLQLHVAASDNLADALTTAFGQPQTYAVQQYRAAWRTVMQTCMSQLFKSISDTVRRPLQALQQLYLGPDKLVRKRHDKLLDVGSAMSKTEKARSSSEPMKLKQAEDELRVTQADYTALNSQLLAELPKLIALSYDLMNMCLKALFGAQCKFAGDVGDVFKQLGQGQQLDRALLQRKHMIVCERLACVSFIPIGFTAPTVEKKVTTMPTLSKSSTLKDNSGTVKRPNPQAEKKQRQPLVFPQKPQMDAERRILQTKYTADRLFQVQHTVPSASGGEMMLSVKVGDLVGVIVNKDPMGNSDRWFVDNGVSQGFVPSANLEPFKQTTLYMVEDKPKPIIVRPAPTAPPLRSSKSEQALIDLSSPQTPTVTLGSHLLDLQGLEAAHQAETPSFNLASHTNVLPNRQSVVMNTRVSINEQRQSVSPAFRQDVQVPLQRPQYYEVPTPAPPVQPVSPRRPIYYEVPPEDKVATLPAAVLVPRRSAPPPPVMAQSPIVEQAPDDVATQDVEFYVMEHDFEPTGPNEIALAQGQVVAVLLKEDLEGNPDWWFVEDEEENQGYAPAGYLIPF